MSQDIRLQRHIKDRNIKLKHLDASLVYYFTTISTKGGVFYSCEAAENAEMLKQNKIIFSESGSIYYILEARIECIKWAASATKEKPILGYAKEMYGECIEIPETKYVSAVDICMGVVAGGMDPSEFTY